MNLWICLFAVSCAVVFYNYAGYALFVMAINLVKRRKMSAPESTGNFYPSVSFIVAAYNEEDCIEKKLINSLQQNYPADKMEILFITDGSSDRTNEIIKRYPAVQLLHVPERRGKTAALNRAVLRARNEILIFSDANTVLNPDATRNITRHYADARVGGVAGEKKVITDKRSGDDVGAGEGLYWKYESFLKKLDSEFYSVVGAAGELFSLRRNLYKPVADQVILDDFIISMHVASQGYRIIYEPDAFAMELPSFSIRDEQKRKVRIAAGGFQAMRMFLPLLAFWKQPRLSFLYISHRVLRWTLSPLCLLLAFISNAVISFTSENPVFRFLFAAQLCFYFMALVCGFVPRFRKFKIGKLAYYFVFMNVSVIQGLFRYLRGKQPAAWEKARRTPSILSTSVPADIGAISEN